MIRTTGFVEMNEVLKGLPLQVSDRVLSNAFADAAKPMVESIKSFTPTGETDNLIDSIGIVKERSFASGGAVGTVQVGPRRKGRYKGYVGHIIEYGTGVRTTKSGANRGSVKANPFMEKGYEASDDVVLGRINTSVGNKISQYIRRTVKR